jgi:hypothetical protein
MNSNRQVYWALAGLFWASVSQADENMFGYVKGAETLPQDAKMLYQYLTSRTDKGQGNYQALDAETEFEYGVTDRLSFASSLSLQSVDTDGLIINGYLPKEESYGLKPSGVEAAFKYNFLSPAKDDLGLATYFALDYEWLDPHSGQDKDKISFELELLLQKYFLEGQMIWVGNTGLEMTRATRGEIDNLPADIEWPTFPEIEMELKLGTGLSYRFAPNWYAGVEFLYETEYETEVGQERWTVFAGPTLHYGAAAWWATFTWLPQLEGGGEQYDGQRDKSLHLIEKTEQEVRLKLGFNF